MDRTFAVLLAGMSFWRGIICVAALIPLAYYATAGIAAVRFFRRERRRTLGLFAPPISVLKPVRGVDFNSYENFRSFCRQDYPAYEILFCVNELKDAAVPLIRQLICDFPDRQIRLLANAPQLGSNRKVSNLAFLANKAKYELLAQSDGDVRVGPNYLRELAASFQNDEVGIVSCLYRGVTQPSLWADMEALGAATDFLPSVLVADWKEGVTFALGASVAITKAWLAKIGGYEAIANVLADDYEIGNQVAKAGGKALISRELVETMYPAIVFRDFWEHQLRWSRTVRLCRPASYFGLLVTHGLPWAIAGAVASGSMIGAVGFAAGYVLMRMSVVWIVGVWGLSDPTAQEKWWMIPFRDALHFAVWVASFFSNRVVWSGTEYRLKANGEMIAIGSREE